MESIIIDLKIKINDIERENLALKAKMTLMYSNWNFDYNKFTDRLKEQSEKCKSGFCKTEIKTENDEISIRK